MITSWVLFSFIVLFFIIQLYLYLGWRSLSAPDDEDMAVFLPVSIIIPVRNESQNIAACIESLINQDYPHDKYEIIVVDDHSDDDTDDIVSRYSLVRLFRQETWREGKKEAIILGIDEALGEIMMTTDGDCVVNSGWISSMVQSLVGSGARLAAGPVSLLQKPGSFIQRFQVLEQAALNILTASGMKTGLIYSASGANMAFYKDTFQAINPYVDNMGIASGDDVFFVQKLQQKRIKMTYVVDKEAVVYTHALNTINGLIRQRLRWGGKSRAYTHRLTQLYLLLFFLANLAIVSLFILSLVNSVFLAFFISGLVLKFIVDYMLIYAGMRWLHQPVCWQDILKSSLFQAIFTIYLAGAFIVRTSPKWKDR